MVQQINHNGNKRSVVRMSISCIVSKNWPYPTTASGSYGREAGRKIIWVNFEFLCSQQVQIFRFLLYLISVKCYYNTFQSAFSQVECILKHV